MTQDESIDPTNIQSDNVSNTCAVIGLVVPSPFVEAMRREFEATLLLAQSLLNFDLGQEVAPAPVFKP